MSIKVVTQFSELDTVEIWAYIDYQGTLADPTGSITVDIYDPDGTKQVDGGAMTKSETGVYYYQYHKGASSTVMAKGKWRGQVKAVDGTGVNAVISTGNFSFKVE